MVAVKRTSPRLDTWAEQWGRLPLKWHLLTIALLLIIRRPGILYDPFLFGEDGKIFLKQAHDMGLSAFFVEYAGYLNFLPRLVGFIGNFLSFKAMSFWFPWSALLLQLYVCSRIIGEERLPFGRLQRLVLAYFTVLVPHNGEVFLTPTNMQWFAALVLCLHVAVPAAEKGREIVRDCMEILLFGLTGPFIILLWPAFLFRSLWALASGQFRKNIWSHSAVLLCATITGAIQITNLATHRAIAAAPPINVQLFFDINYFFGNLLGRGSVTLAIMEFSVLFTTVIVGLIFYTREQRFQTDFWLFLMGLGTISTVCFYVSPHADVFGGNSRYTFIPYLFLAFLLGLVILEKNIPILLRSLSAVLIAIILANSLAHFQTNPRAPQNAWAQLSRAYYEDRSKITIKVLPDSTYWQFELDPNERHTFLQPF